MGWECKYHALRAARNRTDRYFEKGIRRQRWIDIQGWTMNLIWSEKKKTKN